MVICPGGRQPSCPLLGHIPSWIRPDLSPRLLLDQSQPDGHNSASLFPFSFHSTNLRKSWHMSLLVRIVRSPTQPLSTAGSTQSLSWKGDGPPVSPFQGFCLGADLSPAPAEVIIQATLSCLSKLSAPRQHPGGHTPPSWAIPLGLYLISVKFWFYIVREIRYQDKSMGRS